MSTDRPVVGVWLDVPALDRMLDYSVPPGWRVASNHQAGLFDREASSPGASQPGAPVLRVGTIVRVTLRGRRERGWVVELNRAAPPGVRLLPIAKVTGEGPPPDLVALSAWAAHRWAGPRTTFLRAASPERAVTRIPQRRSSRPARTIDGPATIDAAVVAAALAGGLQLLRLPPTVDPFELVAAAAGMGQALILAPSPAGARRLARRLSEAGLGAVHHPDGWAAAAGGATVVGSRAAAWAPAPELAAVVMLDEHDERYREQRSPTWHSRDVVIERARRAGVPCVLVSPMPSLEALALAPEGRMLRLSRSSERRAWPSPVVVDRRDEEPGRSGALSPALSRFLRGAGVAVVVLNRTGRAKLLACASCGELATCVACGAAVGLPAGGAAADNPLVCPRCAAARPAVCARCGAQRLKLLRPGVSRIREELEVLLGEPVVEVTAATPSPLPAARVYVGTDAVLYRLPGADTVAFLDLDSDLGAPRFRAAERTMASLVRAARLLGGRRDGATLVIQTRQPGHPVFAAVQHADPGRLAEVELGRRRVFGYPPFGALAQLTGADAEAFAGAVRDANPTGVGVLGPRNGAWLVTAADPDQLADALAAADRPAKVRIAVDPADA